MNSLLSKIIGADGVLSFIENRKKIDDFSHHVNFRIVP